MPVRRAKWWLRMASSISRTEQGAQPGNGPSQATRNSNRFELVWVGAETGPRTQCLRSTVQVKGSGLGIDGGAGLTVERHEGREVRPFSSVVAAVRSGWNEGSRTLPNGEAWKPIIFKSQRR